MFFSVILVETCKENLLLTMAFNHIFIKFKLVHDFHQQMDAHERKEALIVSYSKQLTNS